MAQVDQKPTHEPTEHERAAARRLQAKRAAKPLAPTLRAKPGKHATEISHSHPDPIIGELLLLEALGTTDREFYDGFVVQLGMAASRGGSIDERTLKFMLAVVKGIEPRDQLETMLATQMAAIHVASMTAAARLASAEVRPQADSAQNALNKLTRTFAAQLEALKRYRSDGAQTIKVQHVTVNDGGQAIVGTVSQGGGTVEKSGGQPHEPSRAAAKHTALPSNVQADAMPMPGAGRAGQERVPVPRSARGSA